MDSPACLGAPAPILPGESLAEFNAFYGLLRAERRPVTVTEQTLVYQIATILWRLRRVPSVESTCFGSFFRLPDSARRLDALSRYESRLIRNHEQLERRLSHFSTLRKSLQPQPNQAASGPAEPAAPQRIHSHELPDLTFQAAVEAATHAAHKVDDSGLAGIHEVPRADFIHLGPPPAIPSP